MKKAFTQITVNQKTQFGKPVIAGTRVPVEVVIGHIAAGDSIQGIMEEYRLTKKQVLVALRYASKVVAEETVIVR